MQAGPSQLGEYRLLEHLGHGGMATVFRGERVGEAGFKKTVAIKRMLPAYRRDPSLLERFAAEARTNARLDHPNLVAVVDFGVKPEPYLVMEFVEGVSLAALLHRLVKQQQGLEVAAACFIGAEAASGLDHAHRKRDDGGNPLGIVHRDVSPQNVLLSAEGAVKVSDFGLVKAADNVVQTGSGIPIGKISYMAPEQAQHQDVDARADVFSLGVVIWEMLAMRVLLSPNDPVRAAQRLTVCDFSPPSKYNPEVTPALDAIVMGCLQLDPTARTPSAQAVGMSLREVLHEVAPGYGRDQLARLLGWSFPERGWQLDEPHETAAQPSLEERMSMPPAETAAEAMQRISEPPAPGLPTQVDVQKAQPIVAAPSSGQVPVAGPYTTGPHQPPQVAQPVKKSGSTWLWILVAITVGVFGLVAVGVLALVLFSAVGEDEQGAVPPPPSGPLVAPTTNGAGAQTTRIDSSVPAQLWAGADRLGSTPIDVALDGVDEELLVLIAPGHRPAVVRRLQLVSQQHFNVTMVPTDHPAQPVIVTAPGSGDAVTMVGESVGRFPGLLLVPRTPLGGLAQLELHFDDGARRQVVLQGCNPLEVCELEVGRPRDPPTHLEW